MIMPNLTRTLGGFLACVLVSSCAGSNEQTTPRRQTVECPRSMMLICEGQGEPSKGGDEEIPGYDRCYCRARPI